MTRSLAVYVLCCASVTVVSAADAPLFPDPDLEAAVRAQVYGKRDNKEPCQQSHQIPDLRGTARRIG